jgi:hypothetical protein
MENAAIPENLAEKPPERVIAPEANREAEPQRETAPQGAEVRAAAPQPMGAAVENAAPQKSAPPAAEKDADRMGIERLLEENLWDEYFTLSKQAREQFRQKGEETAAKLRAVLDAKKVRPGEVHRDIDDWLKLIPKCNPYFRLQEGKIKTDEFMERVKERRVERGEE